MNIDTTKIKRSAGVVIAVAVVGVTVYLYSASVHKPPIVTISKTGTGVPASGSFGIPLATLNAHAPRVAVSVDPLDASPEGDVLRLTFDPSVNGRGREVALVNDTLLLPVTFGRDSLVPQRISITYRNGNLASVRYQSNKSTASTFQVVRPEPVDQSAGVGTEAGLAAAEAAPDE